MWNCPNKSSPDNGNNFFLQKKNCLTQSGSGSESELQTILHGPRISFVRYLYTLLNSVATQQKGYYVVCLTRKRTYVYWGKNMREVLRGWKSARNQGFQVKQSSFCRPKIYTFKIVGRCIAYNKLPNLLVWEEIFVLTQVWYYVQSITSKIFNKF